MKSLLLRAGFTMIELLVVIAVIGVLAVAVLSSINQLSRLIKVAILGIDQMPRNYQCY